jgi:hypothetical protein
MEKWRTTLRVEEIRREISELREANRIYKMRIAHSKEEINRHAQRQRRLHEIMVELEVLSHPKAHCRRSVQCETRKLTFYGHSWPTLTKGVSRSS